MARSTSTLKAGPLNRRITIQEQGKTQDTMGGLSNVYTAVATVWGSIDIQRTSLMYEASTFVSKQIYRITIRFRPDITFDSTYRLQFTSPQTGVVHTYEIQGILNDTESDIYLTFLCYELGGEQ